MRCPDTLYGEHGPLDGRGICPWCGRKVGAKMPRPGLDLPAAQRLARDRDPMQIEPDEGEYYDS